MGFGNRMAMAMLRSPLHGMMSKSLLVLSYEGRRSGKRYELPLQYIADDSGLYIWAGNATAKTWWRNFETPTLVEVSLRHRQIDAKASLVDDLGRRAELLRAYVERYPYTTASGRPKFFGERWRPTADELATAARDVVFVALDPA